MHTMPASADRKNYAAFNCLYPVYFDATRTRAEGRRIQIATYHQGYYHPSRQHGTMCFFAYKKFICRDCGETLRCTTIKRRDCRKRSCNKVVPPGSAVRELVVVEVDLDHDCHFPLIIHANKARREGKN